MVCSRLLLASIALATALQAQGTTATLADGRILTPLNPIQHFITEGPITGVDTATHSIQAQGLTVTIPATVDGVPVSIANTNFAGAPVSAATLSALLDANAAPGGRDTDGALKSGAVRSIFGSSKLQLEATQDAPQSLSIRSQMSLVRSNIAAEQALRAFIQPGGSDD